MTQRHLRRRAEERVVHRQRSERGGRGDRLLVPWSGRRSLDSLLRGRLRAQRLRLERRRSAQRLLSVLEEVGQFRLQLL